MYKEKKRNHFGFSMCCESFQWLQFNDDEQLDQFRFSFEWIDQINDDIASIRLRKCSSVLFFSNADRTHLNDNIKTQVTESRAFIRRAYKSNAFT